MSRKVRGGKAKALKVQTRSLNLMWCNLGGEGEVERFNVGSDVIREASKDDALSSCVSTEVEGECACEGCQRGRGYVNQNGKQ